MHLSETASSGSLRPRQMVPLLNRLKSINPWLEAVRRLEYPRVAFEGPCRSILYLPDGEQRPNRPCSFFPLFR
jgi:hypothetical protein